MTAAVLVTVGLFFLGMGLVALARPTVVPDLFGMTLDGGGDTGRAEIRAVYGGFGLAMAAMLGVALVDEALRDGIVLTISAALAGMAGGRILSALLGDRTRLYPNWFYCGVEALAAAALAATL